MAALSRRSSLDVEYSLWLESHPQPYSYAFPTQAQDSSTETSTDIDGSGSEVEGDEDPLHPYNFDEPLNHWSDNGEFVFPSENCLAPPLDPFAKGYDIPIMPNIFAYQEAFPQLPQYVQVNPFDAAPPVPPADTEATPASPPRGATAPPRRTRTSARGKAQAAPFLKQEPDSSDSEFLVESDVDDSDDEYVDPRESTSRRRIKTKTRRGASGQTRHKARHSVSPYPSSSRSTSARASPGYYAKRFGSATSSMTSPTTSHSRPASRNIQVLDRPPPPRGQGYSKEGPRPYTCEICNFIQGNHRSPDLDRHIQSHFREQLKSQWVCCGVPEHLAKEYRVDPTLNPWTYRGQTYVGGCHAKFSRMDALKRHWDNRKVRCSGDRKFSCP